MEIGNREESSNVQQFYIGLCSANLTSLNKKKKKKKIYNAHIIKHQAWIGGAGSRQVEGRSMTAMRCMLSWAMKWNLKQKKVNSYSVL